MRDVEEQRSRQRIVLAARREVLDRLVDQELAVEKAIEKKLDRSPEVLLALENARREILRPRCLRSPPRDWAPAP